MAFKTRAPAALIVLSGLFLAAVAVPVTAVAPAKLKEYYDKEYGYSFRYPADWRIIHLPEGEANPNMRFILQGIEGSSFMVVVERVGAKTVRQKSTAEQQERMATFMTQTIEQIYRRIAVNLKATAMTVGERRDLSNEIASKYYIATLHQLPAGKPIIVAGIHALPFGKDYSINFIMNAYWDGEPDQGEKILMGVFNSFHLSGEARKSERTQAPDAGGKAQ